MASPTTTYQAADVIDTLCQRLLEPIIPIPRDKVVRESIGEFFLTSLSARAKYRTELHNITETLFEPK